MKSLVSLVSVLSGLVVFAACGEDDKDPLSTVDGFCESWAVRACSEDVENDCAVDEVDCEAAQRKYCKGIVDEDKYDRSGAEKCLDDVREAYDDGRLNARERDTVLNLGRSCALVQLGQGLAGESCKADSDCNRNEDLVCIIQFGQTKGTCEEPSIVGGGESCKDDDEICEEGLYCNGKNCLALPEEDEDCSDTIPCGNGFRCLSQNADGDEFQCEEQLEEGDTDCDSDSDCDTNICLKDEDESVCVQNITFRATDEICDLYRLQ